MKVRARSIPAILVTLLVVGLVVPPLINVGRYRARIAESISQALGRPVSLGGVSLRLLPEPGFNLANVVVEDDPGISAEPILRAEEVTAYLRLSSLWRGRLEIARLHLRFPSLNLVRTPEGDWNVESLLLRASRTEAAPTTARRPQSRPRFPYIEAESGRINYKRGLEKSVFSLTEADFALWSPAENEWRMRLEAKPVRTDLSLTDTGVLRAEGRFRRADLLRDIPMEMRLTWANGQLGQITKLIYGRDRGWRGGAQVNASLDGTPAALKVSVAANVRDFRRFDISSGEPLRLDARCSGAFNVLDQSIRELNCQMPLEHGGLRVSGLVSGPLRDYDLAIAAENVPVNAILAFLRHAKRDLPNDLSAAGVLNAGFTAQRAPGDGQGLWKGSGEAAGVVLRSAALGKNLDLGTLKFSAGLPPRVKAKSRRASSATAANQLRFETFKIPLGAAEPASGSGCISPSAYSLQLQGDSDLERLTQVARATGVAAPRFGVFGAARLNLALSGEWKGFSRVQVSGNAQLRAARAEVPGIASPLQVQSAQVEAVGDRLRVHHLVAQLDKTNFSGEADLPRSCDEGEPCVSQFQLQADTISAQELNAQFNPRLKKRAWYKLFGAGGETSVVSSMQASGRIQAKRLLLGQLTASNVSAEFALDPAGLLLSNTRAEVLGGTQTGLWRVAFAGGTPSYSGEGKVAKLAAAQIASLLRTPLGSGSVSGKYEIALQGSSSAELWNSATGALDFDWQNGVFRNLQLGRAALQFSDFAGRLTLAKQKFELPESRIRTSSGIYALNGSVADGQLALEMARGDSPAYHLRGTLQKPVVQEAASQVAAAPPLPTARQKLQAHGGDEQAKQ